MTHSGTAAAVGISGSQPGQLVSAQKQTDGFNSSFDSQAELLDRASITQSLILSWMPVMESTFTQV